MKANLFFSPAQRLQRRHVSTRFCCAGLALLVSACATSTDQEHAFSQGWRRAQVLQIGTLETAMPGVIAKDCRTVAGRGKPAGRYALVSYSFGGQPNLRAKQVAVVPDAVQLEVGQTVLVNLTDCQAPLALDQNGKSL